MSKMVKVVSALSEYLKLLWAIPLGWFIGLRTKGAIEDYYRKLKAENPELDEELSREERKAKKHKTTFTDAIRLSLPIVTRTYRELQLQGKRFRGLRSIVGTYSDSILFESAVTLETALRACDIEDEARDECRYNPLEYRFRINIAEHLYPLVEERFRTKHREGSLEIYQPAERRARRAEDIDTSFGERLRENDFEYLREHFEEFRQAWWGKLYGIAKPALRLHMHQYGISEDLTDHIAEWWGINSQKMMLRDDARDLPSDLRNGESNILVLELARRGLETHDYASVLGLLGRNLSIIDDYLNDFEKSIATHQNELKKRGINISDYEAIARVIDIKVKDAIRSLRKNVERRS